MGSVTYSCALAAGKVTEDSLKDVKLKEIRKVGLEDVSGRGSSKRKAQRLQSWSRAWGTGRLGESRGNWGMLGDTSRGLRGPTGSCDRPGLYLAASRQGVM